MTKEGLVRTREKVIQHTKQCCSLQLSLSHYIFLVIQNNVN